MARDNAVHYSDARHPEISRMCQDLAVELDHPWVRAVEENWPGPLAHEVYRLRELLQGGQLLGAIWQLKDLAEMLIKFPAIVMIQDILVNSSDSALKKKIFSHLWKNVLSMGNWRLLAGDILAPAVQSLSRKTLFLPEMAGFFRNENGSPTKLYKLLDELNQWRNEEFGHGALKLDLKGFKQDLSRYVKRLNTVLKILDHGKSWTEVSLFITDLSQELPIRGWQTIRQRHQNCPPGHELSDDKEVELRKNNGQKLSLFPFLAVKCCTVCCKNDIFTFDSRKRLTSSDQFHFLDYLAGHKIKRPAHLELSLKKLAGRVRGEDILFPADSRTEISESPDSGGNMDGGFSGYGMKSIDDLLQMKSLDTDYMSPSFLRRRLKAFIEKHDRGICWLRAPDHMGKSVFVHGLLSRSEIEKKSLIKGLKVIGFHIKRECRYHPVQFKEFLRETVVSKDILDISVRFRELPELNLKTRDRAGALVTWLEKLLSLRPHRKLLICLDGLDELVQTREGSLLDFLPSADQLSERLYFLLTSRERQGCPVWVCDLLDERVMSHHDFEPWDVDLQDTGYRSMLRDFFFERMQTLILAGIHKDLKKLLGSKNRIVLKPDVKNCRGGSRITAAVKRDFSELTSQYPHKVSWSGKGIDIARELVNPLLDNYEEVFERLTEKSEGRFLFVSHLTNLLQEGVFAFDKVDRLPHGESIYRHYLGELQSLLSAKEWNYIKRLLLILTAAEEAFARDFNLRAGFSGNQDWQGLPLNVLTDLMGECEIHSLRLLFSLYSLKEILGTWKAGSGQHSYYHLGLKELSSTIRALWPHELDETHMKLSLGFYEFWKGKFCKIDSSNAGDQYRFRYVLAFADLCNETGIRSRIWGDTDLAAAMISQSYLNRRESHYVSASEWSDLAVFIYKHLVEDNSMKNLRDKLAAAYGNRGIIRDDLGQFEGAIEDFQAAIEKYEALRSEYMPKRKWTYRMRNSHAGAYMNLGVTLKNRGFLTEAICQLDQAVDLRENLRKSSKKRSKWTHTMEIDLAMTYMNRGVVYSRMHMLSQAIEDYNQAIFYMETIKSKMESQSKWTLEMAEDLCSAYFNRGVCNDRLNHLPEAIKDFETALALQEEVRRRMGKGQGKISENKDNFHKGKICEINHDQLRTLVGLGICFIRKKDLENALKEFNRAIEIGKKLHRDVENIVEWTPKMAEDFALAYQNRGVVYRNLGKTEPAIRDYSRAIELRELQKKRFTSRDDWIYAMGSGLADCHLNLAVALICECRLDDAVTACLESIKLGIIQRNNHEKQGNWTPKMINSLSRSYMILGIIYGSQGRLGDAIEEHNEAVSLRQMLRNSLEGKGEWTPDMINGLAKAYVNRSFVWEKSDNIENALEDLFSAIELGEVLLYEKSNMKEVHMLARTLLKALDLVQQGSGRSFSTQAKSRAQTFLTKLPTIINNLPDSLKSTIQHLRGAIEKAELFRQERE